MFDFKIDRRESSDHGKVRVIAKDPNGIPLGYATGEYMNSKISMNWLVTFPGYEGHGIGTALLNDIKNYGREMNTNKLTGPFGPILGQDREILKQWYEKRGIQVVGDLLEGDI